MKIRYRARALRDIDEIYHYLEDLNPAGARNVLRAIYAGIHLIGEQPQGSERTDDPSVRVKLVRRYRYRIFYSVVDRETIEILHIRHTSRRPWKQQ